jgi:hypothetical protein
MPRSLGRFETALTLTGEHAPFVVTVVLCLADDPGEAALRVALDALPARRPMLRARIAGDGPRRFRFAAGAPPIPLRSLPRQDPTAWQAVAEDELNAPLDRRRGPLLRCTRLAGADGGDGADLVLGFHHAILDAVSGATLVAELLALLDPGEGGGGAPAVSAEDALLPPVEERFPAPWRGLRAALPLAAFVARQAADELRWRRRCRGLRRPPPVPGARCRILPVELPPAASAALVHRARRERVTLVGALNAALLLAVSRHLYAARPRPLRYVTFADLRPWLRPPLAAQRLGCAASMLRYTAEVDPGRGLWPLARAISLQVDRGGRRGEPFLAAHLSAAAMRALLRPGGERMAATALSYSGVARFGEAAARVRDSHVFVSNLGVGPEYTAQGRWFRDRLQLDVVWLEPELGDAQARTLAADVLDTLAAAGGTEREEEG